MAASRGSTQRAETGTGADLARALTAPLEGLLALADLLGQQSLSEPARAQVRAILDNARRMSRLLNAALDQDGASAVVAVSLYDICARLEADWRGRGEVAQHLIVTCDAAPDLHLMADPDLLRRLMDGLVGAALDARAWGVVELELSAATEPQGVRVAGRLSAPGVIADDTLARRRCAAMLDDLESTLEWTFSPNGGLSAAFAFQAQRADPAQAAAPGETEEAPLPPRTRLLIVDDNATNRIVAAALCEMFGCSTETAEDGLEAVAAARERPFDLILMDIKMPRMDGLEATRAIRALPGAAAATPIVALTANGDPEQVASYLAAGMQAVVDKPIKPELLLNTLQRVLSGEAQETQRTTAAA